MKFICVEGNIGSGKSSLAQKLGAHFNATIVKEEFDENPFLPLFYKKPDQFAFPLEFSFLIDRARQLNKLAPQMNNKLHVADYYIEKCLWFAKHNLQPQQYQQFALSYPSVKNITPPPDLLIFLHLPEDLIVENIRKRGREFEQAIDPSYLKGMNLVYKEQAEQVRDVKHVLNFKMRSNSVFAYERLFSELLSFLDTSSQTRAERLQIQID